MYDQSIMDDDHLSARGARLLTGEMVRLITMPAPAEVPVEETAGTESGSGDASED